MPSWLAYTAAGGAYTITTGGYTWAFSPYASAAQGSTSLGAYRGLYVLNWVYRFFTEPHYHAWIPWVAGVIQTLLYADFFYYFYHCRIKLGMKNVILPQ